MTEICTLCEKTLMLDGTADTAATHPQPSLLAREIAAGIQHAAQPLYDAPDAIEKTAEVVNPQNTHYWTPPTQAVQKAVAPVAPQTMQQAKTIHDAATAIESIRPSGSTTTYNWPSSTPGIQRMQQGLSSIAEQLPTKILYDAPDKLESATRYAAADAPHTWQPDRVSSIPIEGDESKTNSLSVPQKSPSRIVQNPLTQLPASDPMGIANRRTVEGHDALEDLKTNVHRTGKEDVAAMRKAKTVPTTLVHDFARKLAMTQSEASTEDLRQRRDDTEQRRRTAAEQEAVAEDYALQSSDIEQHRRSSNDRQAMRRASAASQARDTGANFSDLSVADHRLPRSRQLRSSVTFQSEHDLDITTQKLDRALIKLNRLLEEATIMMDKAAVSGRHGDIVNIVQATHDTFQSARLRRPLRVHLGRHRYIKLDDGEPEKSSTAATASNGSQGSRSFVSRSHGSSRKSRSTRDSTRSWTIEDLVQRMLSALPDVQQARSTARRPLKSVRSDETMLVHPSVSPVISSGRPASSPHEQAEIAHDRAHGFSITQERFNEHQPRYESYSDPFSDEHRSNRPHASISQGRGMSGFHHKQRSIARNWDTRRKRITAVVACCNTVFVGLLAGIYAGEVPAIQYQIADLDHRVVLGNVLLYIGIAVTTMLCWPLPLLHGRKPYTIAAFAIMLPLQYPQALAVQSFHDPDSAIARVGLLVPRALTGLAMGFANINFLPTLLDLFGASLMSDNPHQEHVQLDDARRQGGGIGLWLGIWSWCYIGSLSVGFCVGACIISGLNPEWGFYITIMLLAVFLVINIVAPETRQAPYRRSVIHVLDHEYQFKRRIANGEVHLHLYMTGPRWWLEEVWAGVVLSCKMLLQSGFFILNFYFAWIYAQVVLVIILLGALLSRWYLWQPDLVGMASLSLALGALFAVPLTHGNVFSRSRTHTARTDSMTFRHNGITWTSHMVRRCIFTLVLPLAGLAYTLASPGPEVSWVVPVVFVGLVGFLSNLAITECIGLLMETYDTCDLQAGVNSRHREKSMPENIRQARTHYSAFPRVCAGFFASQSLGFLLAAGATGVSGTVTRALGAQLSSAGVAGILLILTILLLLALLRWWPIQVAPDGMIKMLRSKTMWAEAAGNDADWRPVVIGNPAGKMRRMNLLETGKMSRWSEIRRLNGLTS